MNSLVASVFVDFTPVLVKQAVTEGMMRGFTFKDFLEKNVYAIKYGQGYPYNIYSYSRKIGARSGVGKSPILHMMMGKLPPIKKVPNGGEFTQTFRIYNWEWAQTKNMQGSKCTLSEWLVQRNYHRLMLRRKWLLKKPEVVMPS